MECATNIILTKKHLQKLINLLIGTDRGLSPDGLVEITFMQNTVLVETDDIVSMLKLNNQK